MACLIDAGLLTSSFGLEGTRDQAQNGCIIVRTREEVTGPRFGVSKGGSAVVLMVELMASGITLPESAPLSSYTCGSVVRV